MRHVLLASSAFLFVPGGTATVEAADLEKAKRFAERGLSTLEEGDAAKAKGLFEKALDVVPELPDGHVGLGHVAMADKAFEDALAHYRSAIDGYVKLAARLADSEIRAYQQAHASIGDLRQELALLGSGDNARQTDAEMRSRRIALEQQIRDIESMPPPRPDHPGEVRGHLYFHVGNALSRLKRWEEAVQAFKECNEREPSFAAAYHNLALAYWNSGRIDDAWASLNKAEELGFQVNPNFKADLRRALDQRLATKP